MLYYYRKSSRERERVCVTYEDEKCRNVLLLELYEFGKETLLSVCNDNRHYTRHRWDAFVR